MSNSCDHILVVETSDGVIHGTLEPSQHPSRRALLSTGQVIISVMVEINMLEEKCKQSSLGLVNTASSSDIRSTFWKSNCWVFCTVFSNFLLFCFEWGKSVPWPAIRLAGCSPAPEFSPLLALCRQSIMPRSPSNNKCLVNRGERTDCSLLRNMSIYPYY